MNNRGEIKLADFGMSRQFSDPPPPNLTQLVVTLWYRAPELLLGTHVYGPEIDIWSIGCVFGELVLKAPLLQGKTETEQLSKIFNLLGMPTEKTWPGFRRLPNARALRLPTSKGSDLVEDLKKLRLQFPTLTSTGVELLSFMLSLNPDDRPTVDEILGHDFFAEKPKPKPTAMFPTFPSKAGGEKRQRAESPNAPTRGEAPMINVEEFSGLFSRSHEEGGGGFSLKLG
jgi:cell division cycle 2-like protein